MPPRPMGAMTSYAPTREPGASAMALSRSLSPGADEGLYNGKPRHVLEGLLGLREGVLAGDELAPSKTRVVLRHHLESAVEVGELVSPAAQDRRVPAVDLA